MLVLRSISQENGTMPAVQSRLGYAGQVGGMDPPSRGEGPLKLSTTNLYIKGLSDNFTDSSLKELCKGYGKVLSTKAVLDPQTFKCKGFGFVDFDCADSAQIALEALRQKGFQVGMAKKQEQAETNVFFKNLPDSMTKEQLEDIVKDCGVVSSVHVMRQNGRNTGVGFARMANRADCERVIKTFNNVMLDGCDEPLLVKFADMPNKSKSQHVKALTGHELQGQMALTAGPTSYLYTAHPPQPSLSIGNHTSYTDNGMTAAMTMAAAQGVSQMPQLPTLGPVMTMPNMAPMPHHPHYPSLAAANYGYLSMAPAGATAYPSLQAAQYGAAELHLQQPPAAAPTAPLYMPSAASMQQVMPGVQAAMDPTVAGMAQWQ